MMQTFIQAMVESALAEDIGSGDISAALISPSQAGQAKIITREDMILCGQQWAEYTFHFLSKQTQVKWFYQDGDKVAANAILCELTGPAQALLSAERTALNFLQLLSAVATKTAAFVDILKGSKTTLLDTRKTIPLWRAAQKYAVKCGGGSNHRMGLYDAFLLKENHIAAAGSITHAILHARALAPDKLLEIEVENLIQLQEALAAKPDVIMLDNFSVAMISEAVAVNAGRVKLEVSGGMTQASIGEIAKLGVDYISVGSLTKDIKAIDLSMRFVMP